MSLDEELGEIPGAFYARYCDDLVFAHPDPTLVANVDRLMDARLHHLGLEANKDKAGNIYFNGAGRRSSDWSHAVSSRDVAFLGCCVSFNGTIALAPDKLGYALQELSTRAQRTRSVVKSENVDKIGQAVCRTINEALNSRSLFCHQSAPLIRHVVTDRQQLKDLDYKIARIVLRVVTGDPSVKAFRRIPYRKIRSDWKLRSLFHARNIAARRTSLVPCNP